MTPIEWPHPLLQQTISGKFPARPPPNTAGLSEPGTLPQIHLCSHLHLPSPCITSHVDTEPPEVTVSYEQSKKKFNKSYSIFGFLENLSAWRREVRNLCLINSFSHILRPEGTGFLTFLMSRSSRVSNPPSLGC